LEKRIAIWSYWLGVLCTVLTIVLRGLAAFGVFAILVPASGAFVSYYTFLRGGVCCWRFRLHQAFWQDRAASPQRVKRAPAVVGQFGAIRNVVPLDQFQASI
jgi:hypothetical protein